DASEQIDRKFFVLRASNFSKAIRFFERFHTEEEPSEEIEGMAIRHISSTDVTGNFFGQTFGGFKETYYVGVEPYLIFCNSQASMKAYLESYLHGKRLV